MPGNSRKLAGSAVNRLLPILITSVGCATASAGPELGARISFQDDSQAVECAFARPHSTFDKVHMDRKDTRLTALKKGAKVEEFERIKYLDSAVLLRSTKNPGRHALIQVLMNGEVTLTEGELIEIFEKNCEDTGASKLCKNEVVKSLAWSPERLTLESAAGKFGGAIDSYGFFANHATYFRAGNLTLIDYGSPIDLVAGKISRLKCRTVPDEEK